VLIFNRARLLPASWRAAYAGAALTLPLVTLAYADTLYVGGCVGAPGTVSCVLRVGPAGDPYVRTVPQPETDAEKARYAPVKVKLLLPYGDGWLVEGVDDDDNIVVRGAGVLWSLQGVGARQHDDDD